MNTPTNEYTQQLNKKLQYKLSCRLQGVHVQLRGINYNGIPSKQTYSYNSRTKQYFANPQIAIQENMTRSL